MRLPLNPCRPQVNYPPLGQIQIISRDAYIRRPPNFYPSCSCILWTCRTHFWCPFQLRWSRFDDLSGIACTRAQTKLAKYFLTNGFFINHTGRIIVPLYHCTILSVYIFL